MKAPRKPARTKRTATGKVMGRPVKRSGAALPPVEPEAPRLRRYVKAELGPRPIVDPDKGEVVGERPARTVYEWREPHSGRPAAKDATKLLWIVRAGRVEELERQERKGLRDKVEGKSALRQVAEAIYEQKEGQSASANEQQLRRALREMRVRRLEFPE